MIAVSAAQIAPGTFSIAVNDYGFELLSGAPRDSSVALSWAPPANDGGSSITSYRITPSVGGVAQTPIQTGSTASNHLVTGLTNGTTYTFTVAAANVVGMLTGRQDGSSAGLVMPASAGGRRSSSSPGAPTIVPTIAPAAAGMVQYRATVR